MRPSQQAMKLLVAIKKRHLPHCGNVGEVVQKLWDFYNEQHAKIVPTEDLNLLESTPCACRFALKEAMFCGYGLPSRKSRKLISLKECEVCIAKNGPRLQKIAIRKAKIDLSNVRGRGQSEKVENLREYAEKLAKGQHLKHCSILKEGRPLLELPCVTQTNQFERDYNCKYPDCEALVRDYVRSLYIV